eukprot:CAMPEP_0181324696 /NCGR_PEP_ID=MMETSP1101-20121128/20505_1 /TAXON_ID=46948 /ORGANISM="Rhodomonas abbreviata, Strain Caron Lab Isolate" /LENGTH=301 /DNA_ID=CAMNT_0023432905 /DNA_START=111 /DNA_END=1016 /DNA_ORIENTATION=+
MTSAFDPSLSLPFRNKKLEGFMPEPDGKTELAALHDECGMQESLEPILRAPSNTDLNSEGSISRTASEVERHIQFAGNVDFEQHEEHEPVRPPSPHPRRLSDGGHQSVPHESAFATEHGGFLPVVFAPNVVFEEHHDRLRHSSPHPRHVPEGREPEKAPPMMSCLASSEHSSSGHFCPVVFAPNVVFEEHHDRLRPPSPHPRRLSEGGQSVPHESCLSTDNSTSHHVCPVVFKENVIFDEVHVREEHERFRDPSPHPRSRRGSQSEIVLSEEDEPAHANGILNNGDVNLRLEGHIADVRES